MRGQNKPADVAVLHARQDTWFDHYLKGTGSAPSTDVEALTTTCPTARPQAARTSARPGRASLPARSAPRAPAAQTIVPAAGDPSRGQAYDPIHRLGRVRHGLRL